MTSLDKWGIPLIILSGWVALILVIMPLLLRRFRKKAEQSQREFKSFLLYAFGPPLLLILLAIGLKVFEDMIPELPRKWEKYYDYLLLILLVFSGYLFLDRLMQRLLARFGKTVDVAAAGVIKTLYRIALFTFAAFIVLDRLNINITPFIASLGIGGIVVALALQDTLSNFFSGLYLYFDKPIRIGDFIRLESGEEGYVTHVGWHSTRIRMLSNNIVIVSNTKLAGSRITNYYLPESEITFSVNVTINAQNDLDTVERTTLEIAKEVLREAAGGVKEFEPFARFSNFSETGANLTVTFRAGEYANQFLIIHEFIKRLHRRFRKEGIIAASSSGQDKDKEVIAPEPEDEEEQKKNISSIL